MPDDVVLNKVARLEHCVTRIREVHAGEDAHLFTNLTTQESILLNIQRACEVAIDLAMHLVRKHGLGVPQDSRDAFELLQGAKLLDGALADSLKRMVGLRNLIIRQYKKLNLDILKSIITHRLDDFLAFARQALQREA